MAKTQPWYKHRNLASTNQHSECNVRVTRAEYSRHSNSHLQMTDFVRRSRLRHGFVQVEAFECPVDYTLQSIYTLKNTRKMPSRMCTTPLRSSDILHPFNGLFSRTTWVSRHQNDKPLWILVEQEMVGWLWHQLDHIQFICTSLQTDNHTSTSPLRFLQARCPSCRPTNSIKALKALTCSWEMLVYIASGRFHTQLP